MIMLPTLMFIFLTSRDEDIDVQHWWKDTLRVCNGKQLFEERKDMGSSSDMSAHVLSREHEGEDSQYETDTQWPNLKIVFEWLRSRSKLSIWTLRISNGLKFARQLLFDSLCSVAKHIMTYNRPQLQLQHASLTCLRCFWFQVWSTETKYNIIK